MISDFLDDKIGEAASAVRKYRGEAVPAEQAASVEAEICNSIMQELPNPEITLAEWLGLYVHTLPIFGGALDCRYVQAIDGDPGLHDVRVFLTADNYHPENPFPLIFHNPLNLLNPKNELKIKNLRRFLADYQTVTGTWIGAKDILQARITGMFLDLHGNYGDSVVLIGELK